MIESVAAGLPGRSPSRPANLLPGGGVTNDADELVGIGYSDSYVAERGREEGERRLQTDEWGSNRADLALPRGNNRAALAHEQVAAFHLEATLATVDGTLCRLRSEIEHGLAEGMTALGDVELRTLRHERVRVRCERDGLAIPAPPRRLGRMPVPGPLGWLLLVLGVGDLLINSKSFQIFGLSDADLVPHVPVNELYLAAVASLVGLLVLADRVGHLAARVAYVDRHRDGSEIEGAGGAGSAEAGDTGAEEPSKTEDEAGEEAGHGVAPVPRLRVGPFDVVTLICCVAGGAVLLAALGGIRAAYLAASPQPTGGMSPALTGLFFVGIQAGIFVAAAALACHYTHPYRDMWSRTLQELAAATGTAGTVLDRVHALKGEYDGEAARFRHEIMRANRLACAVLQDTGRQNHLWMETLTNNLPEPVTERLFPDDLPYQGPELFANGVVAQEYFPSPAVIDLSALAELSERIRRRTAWRHGIDDRKVDATAGGTT